MSSVKLHMIISTLLLFTSVIVLVTGIILYLKTTNILSMPVRHVPMKSISTIHIYFGFITAGIALIHVYLNWPALKSYFRSGRRR